MTFLARLKPSRMMLAVLAAAAVFMLTSPTMGGYEGSIAQPAASPSPGATPTGGTPAKGELETSAPEGNGARVGCKQIEEARGGFLLGKIVPCLLKTIQTSSSRMSREMIEMFRPTFFAFLTFVMVIFGVQVLQNEGQLQARAFVLLLKIGFCLAILAAIPGDEQTGEGGLLGTAYGIMAETQASVMSVLGPGTSGMHCEIERFGDENTPMVWKQMDCLLGKLYGFTIGSPGANGEARPNMLLASSMLGLMGGFFFGGSFGVAVFLACLTVLISMFTLVLRVLVAFVNSYMFIALYMILAPLLLPLMFLKVTTSIFEKWYSGIIAAILLPMVICGYVVLAMQMYDRAFFAPDALINQLFNQEFMQRAQEAPRQMCDQSVTNDPGFRELATGRNQQQLYTNNPFMTNLVNPFVSGANNMCGGLQRTVLNLNGMPDPKTNEYQTQRQAFTRLFTQLAEIALLTLLVTWGFSKIMDVARAMLGSGAVVGALDTGTPQEQKFKEAIRSSRESFSSSFTNQGGTAFLQQIPTATSNAGRGFLRGMGMEVGPDAPPGGQPPANSGQGGAQGGAAAGGTAGGAASGGGAQPSGGNAGGGDDGPDGGSSGGNSGNGNASGGARPGAANSGPAAQRSIRNATPDERRTSAQEYLSAEDARRFEELDNMIERGGLPADRREELQEEYDRLIAQIDREVARRS